ncbi:hypothetical protein HPP92_017624 [Vanilla planifolia]|uniref:Uncharacterized protein n=1 Tax=Vanilla planifolia TaxID=51239 RepID=A0A835UQR3_VANPL|nr:hypothetical protein HPP92_017624 [Vanilla planifolia]
MEASSDILTLNRESALIPKGKEKMEEEKNGDAAICGICLTEGSLAPRGWIDSCDHYFCFICIMEWAKVESRCPMCKQRFQSIRRSEVPGLFVSERVLEIPVRNQVYHPLGNESTAISDPYAQANCQVCHGYGDEELLLLCDLCDSAFHTYCTGLGHTVPEGDWYCNDCTILREEYSRIERDDDYRDSAFQENHSFDQISKPLVSIFEIVTDESSRIKSSVNHHFHRSSVRGDQTSQQRTSKDLMLHVEKSESSGSPSEITDSNLRARLAKQRARTLLQPCNLQSRIQVLRENWNSLRGGSVAFSSVFYGNDKTSEGSIRTSPLTKQSISSPANEKQVTDPNYSRTMVTNSMSQDVEKAWKMMQKAKKQKLTVDKSSLNSIGLISSAASVTVSKGHVSHSFRDLTSKNRIEAEKMVGCSTSGTSKLPSFKVVQNWHQFPFINHQLLGTKALNPCEHVDRIGLPTSTVVQKTHIKGFTQDGEMAARKKYMQKFIKSSWNFRQQCEV